MLVLTHRVAGDEVTIRMPQDRRDLHEFSAWCASRTGRYLGLDTETSSLRVYDADHRCRTVQIGDAREAWVLPVEAPEHASHRVHVRAALAAGRFVVHNAAFDLQVLDRHGLADFDDLGPRIADTYILGHLCDPRTASEGGTGLGLKALSSIYVDSDAEDTSAGLHAVFRSEFKATKDTGWGIIPVNHPLYVRYAGLDAVYVARLLVELGTLVRSAGMSALAQMEHEVQLSTTAMARRGLLVDEPYTRALVNDLAAEADHHRARAAELGVANVNSTRQVVAALEASGEMWSARTASGAASVGKEALLPMADLDPGWSRLHRRTPNPVADAVVRAKRAEKWRTAYAAPFISDRDANGRIHPSIKSLAARTARMSVSAPPLQQLPSGDWTIRRAIIADPGNVMISVDYQAIELRVLAALAGVTQMRAAIERGDDLHDTTARLVYGEGFTKADRKMAKIVGLGKVYGGGAAGLSRQSGAPLEDVKRAVAAYEAAYPEVATYARKLQREAQYGGGHITTPTGRPLPADRNRTYALTNYAVQSTARDVLARALLRLERAGLGEHMLLPIHDEVLFQAPVEDAHEFARTAADLMTDEIRGIPLGTDAEVGSRSWGSLYGAPEDTEKVLK
ncbi:MAG: DNA polymerase [Angustibacter sp.]